MYFYSKGLVLSNFVGTFMRCLAACSSSNLCTHVDFDVERKHCRLIKKSSAEPELDCVLVFEKTGSLFVLYIDILT